MGLDIRLTRRKENVCPHCGIFIDYKEVDVLDSSGRVWYPFLESIGYYVPYEQRTEENDWYGKDMVLTKEQTQELYGFVHEHDVYNYTEIVQMVVVALDEKDDILVNADW